MRTYLKIAVCIAVFVVSTPLFSQTQYTDQAFLEYKVKKFKKMQVTGALLSTSGAALTIGGIVLASQGSWEKHTQPSGGVEYQATDAKAAVGLIMAILGVPVTAGGIVFSAIGSKKVKQYSKKLENINVGAYQHGDATIIKLTYRF